MCPFSADLYGIAPGAAVNALLGTCTLNSGFTYGLPEVTYCVTGTGTGPYTVNILADNVFSNATYLCNFTGADINEVDAPNMFLDLVLTLNATATINLDPLTIQTTVNSYDINMDSSQFNGLKDVLTKIFNVSLNELADILSTDKAVANFYATAAATALQVAQSGCATSG